MNATGALMLLEDRELKKYELMQSEVVQIVRTATSEALATQDQANRLAELLARGHAAEKELDISRRAAVDPMNKQVKTINALFALLTDQLEALDMRGKRLIGAWQQQERARIQREQDAARQKQEEAARREAEAVARAQAAQDEETRKAAMAEAEAASREQAVAVIEEPHEAPRGIKTDSGSVSTRQVWKFEVIDAALVPRTFCCPDEKHIGAAVRAGVREITGVHIFPEDVGVVRVG